MSATSSAEVYRAVRRPAARIWRLLPYWSAVLRGSSLDRQISRLPRRLAPEVRWIQLDNIRLATDVRVWRRATDGFGLPGDWDRQHVHPRPSIFDPATSGTVKAMTHETVRALFLDGRDFRSTAQYEAMVEAVRANRPEHAYGCRSLSEVADYFAHLLRAYDAMRQRGYLTQDDLGGEPGDEIKLYVTRNGQWCHGNGGNHRIRIAELLGFEWVPFVVAGAHCQWLKHLSDERHQPPRAAFRGWLAEIERAGTLRRRAEAHA